MLDLPSRLNLKVENVICESEFDFSLCWPIKCAPLVLQLKRAVFEYANLAHRPINWALRPSRVFEMCEDAEFTQSTISLKCSE